MSKKMTPCEKLGYKVGDKFKVSKQGSWFRVGEKVELGMDDGSNYPYFFNERMPKDSDGGWPLHIESVEKVSMAKLKPAKQALADAIHQNGGWARVATFAVSGHGCVGTTDTEFVISFFNGKSKPSRDWENYWSAGGGDSDYCGDANSISITRLLPNWHQTILSRDEYFAAYPERVNVEVNNETGHKVEVEMKSESEMTIKIGGDWHKNGELPPVGEVCEAYIDYPPQWIETEILAHKDGFAIGWCKSVMKGCHGDKAHEFRPLRSDREKAIDEIISTAKKIGWNSEMANQIIGEVAVELYEAGYRKEVK